MSPLLLSESRNTRKANGTSERACYRTVCITEGMKGMKGRKIQKREEKNGTSERAYYRTVCITEGMKGMKGMKIRKGLSLFCRRELRFLTSWSRSSFFCRRELRFPTSYIIFCRSDLPVAILSESRNTRKGRKKRKIWKMRLRIRCGFLGYKYNMSGIGVPSYRRGIAPSVFSSFSSPSVRSVIQTKRRGSRPVNQRYERLMAFPAYRRGVALSVFSSAYKEGQTIFNTTHRTTTARHQWHP